MEKENGLFKVRENKKMDDGEEVSFCVSLLDFASKISALLPFCKLAVLFDGDAKKEDLLLLSALKNCGLKPIAVYVPKNFKLTIDNLSGFFCLAEDTRAVLSTSARLSSVVNYIASVRSITAFFLLDDGIEIAPFYNHCFVFDGEKIAPFFFNCEKRIVFFRKSESFVKNTILLMVCLVGRLIDCRLFSLTFNLPFIESEYERAKFFLFRSICALSVDKGCESDEEIINCTVNVIQSIKTIEGKFFGDFPTRNAPSAFSMDKRNKEQRVLSCEKSLRKLLNNKSNDLKDFSGCMGQVLFAEGKCFKVSLNALKKQISGANNAIKVIKENEREIKDCNALFFSIKKGYEMRFGKLKG